MTVNACGIYRIKNTVNGKIYIGSAVNLRLRMNQHRRALMRGYHGNIKLTRAWAKYGEPAFRFDILEFVEDKHKLLDHEQYWLDLTNCADPKTGYNISRTAGSLLGHKMSDEAKAKMRLAKLGTKRGPHSAETRAKISASNTGKKHSPEALEKMAKAKLGKKRSPEALAKFSETWKRKRENIQNQSQLQLKL